MSNPGLSHLRGGVAQSSVSEKTLNKAKLVIREKEAEFYWLLYAEHSRPTHFVSWVARSGVVVHWSYCTPNH